MENLIFSINIILPLFLVIVLGAILKKTKMLSEAFCKSATDLVFYVALPCSLYRSVCSTNVSEVFNVKFVVFLLSSQLIAFLGCWFLAKLLVKERSQRSAVVHGAVRGNYAYIGMAVLYNILNTDTLKASVMIMAFGVTFYNVLAVVVLSYYDPSGKKVSILDQIKKIITNPLIISIGLGLIAANFKFVLPTSLDKFTSYLAQLATPLALILIGAKLDASTFVKKPFAIILATFLKLVVLPLAVTFAAILFGFVGEELITLYVYMAVPSATNSYIMTKNMNGDGDLAAGIVMLTSLVSVITMTVGIFLLKTLGYI